MARENPCALERVYPPGRRTRPGRQFPRTRKPQIGLELPEGGGGEQLRWFWPGAVPEGFDMVQIRYRPTGTKTYTVLLEHDPDDGHIIPIEGLYGCYRAVGIGVNGKWVSSPSESVKLEPTLRAAGDRRFFSGAQTLIERSI